MSNWTATSPAATEPGTKNSAEQPAPIARITVEVFSTRPGDSTVSVWADRHGPMADAQGDFGPKRQQALARLKNISVRAVGTALDNITG